MSRMTLSISQIRLGLAINLVSGWTIVIRRVDVAWAVLGAGEAAAE